MVRISGLTIELEVGIVCIVDGNRVYDLSKVYLVVNDHAFLSHGTPRCTVPMEAAHVESPAEALLLVRVVWSSIVASFLFKLAIPLPLMILDVPAFLMKSVEACRLVRESSHRVLGRESELLAFLDPYSLSETLLVLILNEVLLVLLGVHLVGPTLALKLFGLVKLNDDCPFLSLVLLVQEVLPPFPEASSLLARLLLSWICAVPWLFLEPCEARLGEHILAESAHAHLEAVEKGLARKCLLTVDPLKVK